MEMNELPNSQPPYELLCLLLHSSSIERGDGLYGEIDGMPNDNE